MAMKRMQHPPRKTTALRENIITTFYPGFRNTRQQGAKYAGPEGVPVYVVKKSSLPAAVAVEEQQDDTTENVDIRQQNDETTVVMSSTTATRDQWTVVSTFAPRILHNVCPLEEVHDAGYGWSWNPLHWADKALAYGIGWYFRMEHVRPHHVHLTKLNIGGDLDQSRCRQDVAEAVKLLDNEQKERTAEEKKKHLVMFGCSRGATTTLYTALNLPKHLAERVSLVIVEAPFDTLEAVAKSSSWAPGAGLWLLDKVGHYTPEAYSLPDTTHLRCPIAFITSQKDTRVPPKHTMALHDQVKEKYSSSTSSSSSSSPQIPHVYHLELRNSHHSFMPCGDADDQELYIDFVEELYERHCS